MRTEQEILSAPRAAVITRLRRMPTLERCVIIRLAQKGASMKGVAQDLNLSVPQVRMAFIRALKA